MERLLVLFCLLVLSVAARADCPPTVVSAVLAQLQMPLRFDQNHNLVDGMVRCQLLAADPTRSVLALSLRHPKDDGHNDQYDIYSLDLVMLRSADGKLLARYTKPDQFLSDAVALQDIKLDMGFYTLTSNIRAFGVRANFSISGLSVDNYQSLTLFVEQANTITEVLSNMVTAKIHYDGGYGTRCTAFDENTSSNHLYAGQLLEVVRQVAVAPQKTHGYADLQISETDKAITTRNINGTCTTSDDLPTKTSLTLQYDGSRYVVPAALQPN